MRSMLHKSTPSFPWYFPFCWAMSWRSTFEFNVDYFALFCTYKIDYFELSVVFGGVNCGQTSIKCCDLACDAESPPLKSCEDLNIKLEVKYFCPTSSWGAKFYIYQWSYASPKSNLHPCMEISSMTSPTLKSSGCCVPRHELQWFLKS